MYLRFGRRFTATSHTGYPMTPAARPPRFRRLRALLANEQRRHRALLFLGLGTMAAVSAMAFLADRFQYLPFDLSATTYLQRVRITPFRTLMGALSFAGYYPWSPLVVMGACLLVGIRLGWRDGAYLLFITAVQGGVNHLIKTAIGRPRPADTVAEIFLPHAGMSFPSGHVMLYTVLFGFLFFLAWTRMRRGWLRALLLGVAVVLVLGVGPSRIYLGAHWLSDVVAGHLIGIILLLLAIEGYVKFVVRPLPATA